MATYEIQHKKTGLCLFTAHADDEIAALDEYAGWRSGYGTFEEMSLSPTFSPLTNVHAVLVDY